MDMGVHMKTWKYVAYHLINKLLDKQNAELLSGSFIADSMNLLYFSWLFFFPSGNACTLQF